MTFLFSVMTAMFGLAESLKMGFFLCIFMCLCKSVLVHMHHAQVSLCAEFLLFSYSVTDKETRPGLWMEEWLLSLQRPPLQYIIILPCLSVNAS